MYFIVHAAFVRIKLMMMMMITPSLGVIPCEYRHKLYCYSGLQYISLASIFNHFYAVSTEGYRIRRNNAK